MKVSFRFNISIPKTRLELYRLFENHPNLLDTEPHIYLVQDGLIIIDTFFKTLAEFYTWFNNQFPKVYEDYPVNIVALTTTSFPTLEQHLKNYPDKIVGKNEYGVNLVEPNNIQHSISGNAITVSARYWQNADGSGLPAFTAFLNKFMEEQ